MFRKLRSLTAAYYAEHTEYRAELFLWVLSNMLPFILMGVWMQAGRSGQFALTEVDFARYFFAVFVVRNFTLVWVVWEFERDVVEGILSYRLLQPTDPGWRYFAAHLAERVARMPMVVALAVIFFAIYPAALWLPTLAELALAAAAIATTFLMRYAVQYAFAMLAFWTERAHSVEQLWFLPYMFLSGMVAPLELYPEAMQKVLPFTPFPYLIWFPSRLLVGADVQATAGISVATGFAVMIFWAVVFFAIYRWLWRKGLRKYSAMGA